MQVLRWSTKYEAHKPDALPQKAVHPSAEYHFSAIDSFDVTKAGSSGKGDETEQKLDTRGNHDAATHVANQADSLVAEVDSPLHELPQSSSSPLEPELETIWSADVSTLLRTQQADLTPFERPHACKQQSLIAEREDQADRDSQSLSTSTSSSVPSAQWKALLRNYYRMGTPILPRSLQSEASALVEHYFRDVCVIFSAFDSTMNPFRTVIARVWDTSSSIFFAIQSMAAAHLANYMPNMQVTGLSMQRKAYECLQHELQLASINKTMDDKLLLAVLLLGITACWHDSSDLGAAHLSAARALIYPRLLRPEGLQGMDTNRNDQFFGEALIYWEMCMAFVSQENFVPGIERHLLSSPAGRCEGPSERKVFPHPWTGIAPRVQMLLAEVGRLVRHYCTMRSSPDVAIGSGSLELDTVVAAAQGLEEELLSICLPGPEDLVDVQDEKTLKADFINVAEATKCAALLEIYCTFPQILTSRLGGSATGNSSTTFLNLESTYTADTHPSNTSWLTSLANHILDLLTSVPSTSGTRPLQLIPLVISSAELRLTESIVSSTGISTSTSYDLEVARARGFAMTRLNELASRLPSKPVIRIIELIREVWRRNDAGEDVFWVDVMIANGWETIMG